MSTEEKYSLPQKQTVYFTRGEYTEHAELAEHLRATSIKDYVIKLRDDRRTIFSHLSDSRATVMDLQSENEQLKEQAALSASSQKEFNKIIEIVAPHLENFNDNVRAQFADPNFLGLSPTELIEAIFAYVFAEDETTIQEVVKPIYERAKTKLNEKNRPQEETT